MKGLLGMIEKKQVSLFFVFSFLISFLSQKKHWPLKLPYTFFR